MAAGSIPLTSTKNQGLRPVDLRRDLRQIASLMDICFGDSMDQNSRGAVREMEVLSRSGPLLWFLGSMTPNWQLGYVWVEDGKIVGNVSTQMAEFDRYTWLIANVAVHPDYRRRGIATALTAAATDLASQNNARRALLQVHQHNTTAYNLYSNLGFNVVTTRSTWERVSLLEPPSAPLTGLDLRPARREDWQTDFNFVARFRSTGFSWLRPLRKADWRPSFWRALSNFLTGVRDDHWLAWDKATNQIAAAFYISTGLSTTDDINLVVGSDWQGRVERPLLAAALHRLGRRPWTIRLDHPTPDAAFEAAFQEFGFRRLQTLVWMERKFL